MLFLFLGAKVDEHRAEHRSVECQGLGRRGEMQFFEKDEALGRAPAGSAVLDRPARRSPSLAREDSVPFDALVLGQYPAGPHRIAGRRGQVRIDKRPDLIPEQCLF